MDTVYVRMKIGAYAGLVVEVPKHAAENGLASGSMEAVTPAEREQALAEERGDADPEGPRGGRSALGDELLELEGIGAALAERLRARGFNDLRSLSVADVREVAAIPGLGSKRAKEIIDAARESLDDA